MIARTLESQTKRIWGSPWLNTIAASSSRGVAFFCPVPFLTSAYDANFIALWFLIIMMHSLTALAIGNLPVILMHMVSHAAAGQELSGAEGDRLRLASLAHGIRAIFTCAGLFYILLALALFTPLLWRQLTLTGDLNTALTVWAIFVIGTVLRITALSYGTLLLGLNQVAPVRRLEAGTWLAGGIASAFGAMIWRDIVVAMILLQAPAAINYMGLRALAMKQGWSHLVAQGTGGGSQVWREALPGIVRGSIGLFAAYLSVYGSGIIYAQFGDSASIASFSFTIAIFGLIAQLSLGHTLGNLPSLSIAYAGGQSDRLRRLAARTNLVGMLSYCSLTAFAFAAIAIIESNFPNALPEIDQRLFLLFALANIPVRYGSFHLHLYTVTNDIRWHTYQLGTALLYFPLVFALGVAWLPSYPIAQFAANIAFAVPYARRLTWRKLGFPFSQEAGTLWLMAGFTMLLSWRLCAATGWTG